LETVRLFRHPEHRPTGKGLISPSIKELCAGECSQRFIPDKTTPSPGRPRPCASTDPAPFRIRLTTMSKFLCMGMCPASPIWVRPGLRRSMPGDGLAAASPEPGKPQEAGEWSETPTLTVDQSKGHFDLRCESSVIHLDGEPQRSWSEVRRHCGRVGGNPESSKFKDSSQAEAGP